MLQIVVMVCVVQELDGPLEVTKAKCPHFTLKEMEAQAASCLGLAATCVTLDM